MLRGVYCAWRLHIHHKAFQLEGPMRSRMSESDGDILISLIWGSGLDIIPNVSPGPRRSSCTTTTEAGDRTDVLVPAVLEIARRVQI